MNEHERKDTLKRMEAAGVNILDLPRVHDDASLFDYTYKILSAFSNALGTEEPTYEVVADAAEIIRDQFDF